jgi:hypothetical protein
VGSGDGSAAVKAKGAASSSGAPHVVGGNLHENFTKISIFLADNIKTSKSTNIFENIKMPQVGTNITSHEICRVLLLGSRHKAEAFLRQPKGLISLALIFDNIGLRSVEVTILRRQSRHHAHSTGITRFRNEGSNHLRPFGVGNLDAKAVGAASWGFQERL